MAEIFYEGKKKYNCRKNGKPYFRMSATINGKRYEFYGDGEKDAKKKIEEAKKQANDGYNLDKRTAKVGATFKYWLFNVKRVDKKIKASTFSAYESRFRNHIEPYPIAQKPLSSLDSAIMQKYVTELYEDYEVSAPAIEGAVKLWRMFCTWACDEGFLIKNPCRNLSLPGKHVSARREVETFSREEVQALSKYMDEHDYQYDTLIRLAFATGMRLGELLSLTWENVDLDRRVIRVRQSTAVVTHVDKNGNRERYREVWDTKTANSVRDIPITEKTVILLSEHHLAQKKYFFRKGYPQTEYVFTTSEGKLIDASSLNKSFKRLLERAGIPYRKFHAIRHTFATEAIRSGVNVKDLQMLMGHADIDTTYVYVHADEESKRKAIEMMSFPAVIPASLKLHAELPRTGFM